MVEMCILRRMLQYLFVSVHRRKPGEERECGILLSLCVFFVSKLYGIMKVHSCLYICVCVCVCGHWVAPLQHVHYDLPWN